MQRNLQRKQEEVKIMTGKDPEYEYPGSQVKKTISRRSK